MWLPFCRIYDRKENCVRKYDFISALAKETAAEVVKNREEWMKYLTTATRLYKYSFREQLLIYAQRPDATACASIELWNERMEKTQRELYLISRYSLIWQQAQKHHLRVIHWIYRYNFYTQFCRGA